MSVLHGCGQLGVVPVSEEARPGGGRAKPGGGFEAFAVLAAAASLLKLPMKTAENASLKNKDDDPLAPKGELSSLLSTGPSRSCARRSASKDSYLVSSTLPLVKKAGSPSALDENRKSPPNALSCAMTRIGGCSQRAHQSLSLELHHSHSGIRTGTKTIGYERLGPLVMLNPEIS